MIAIKAVPFYLDVGASFYSSLTINWRFMVSNFDDFPVKTMNPHRIGIHGGDLRKSVIDKHVSIWVDRCGSGVSVENRFSCTQNYLHVPKPPLTLPCFPDTTIVTFLGPMNVPPGLQVMLPKNVVLTRTKMKCFTVIGDSIFVNVKEHPIPGK